MRLSTKLSIIAIIAAAFTSCVNEDYDLEKLNTEMNVLPGITVPLDYQFSLDGEALTKGLKAKDIEAGDTLVFNVNKTINFGDVLPKMLDMEDALLDLDFNGYSTMPVKFVVKVESTGFEALNDFEITEGSDLKPALSNAIMSLKSASLEDTKAKIALSILVINETGEKVSFDKDMMLHVASESVTFSQGINIKL